VPKQFATLDELIESLRSRGLREVTLSGRVATTTTPKGEQITFRGRLVATADLGTEERGEYVEEVAPHSTRPEAPDLEISEAAATDLQRAQTALARQLHAYRDEYQGTMEAARARVTQALRDAGMVVVEGEG
jgi:hypothetical protein